MTSESFFCFGVAPPPPPPELPPPPRPPLPKHYLHEMQHQEENQNL